MAAGPTILVVDNYDSFVYNLVQYLAELGATVRVARNDAVSASDVSKMELDGVLISPGPGYPANAGNCLEIVRYCYDASLPLLGVCLGHQALGEAFGATIVPAPGLLHGRSSLVEHDNAGVRPRRWWRAGTTRSWYRMSRCLTCSRCRRAAAISSWESATAARRSKECSSIPNRS